jgi:tetratricopeptide (TPR) repeat protein
MHRLLALVLSLIFALTVFAQTPAEDPNVVLIREGVALMDSGRFDDAIAKLRTVLTNDPGNDLARYELGLAFAGKGDGKQCLATLEPLSVVAGPHQAASLAMVGNCLDHLGQRAKAIEAYRRGLKIAPDESSLLFNLAITLAQTGGMDEARALVKNNARKNPWHISGHFLLAEIFETQGFRVPAAFSFLRYLALDPSSTRSADAATRLRGLMGLGVAQTSKKGVNITIDPKSSKEEGDFSTMEMMLSMVAASEMMEKKRGQSDFERAQGSLVTAIKIFLESREPKEADFTSAVQGPFFNAMDQEKLLETFAGLALSTQKLRGTEPWMKKNATEIDRYRAWIAPQAKAAIVMPAPVSVP